ncbi:MAG: type II secretion system protein GspE, partial [Clostridia bacterium]|nr:type II secretion system protein GspE [Clostridia bacterium]
MQYKRLGEVLLAAGTIDEETLQKGLQLQKGTKQRLGTVLIENGLITEKELLDALQMQLGLDFVDLTKINIPTELAQSVPKNMAKQYQIVPVRAVKDELYLAMSDPLNFYAIEEVRKAVHKRIIPVVATASAIDHTIQTLYSNENAARAIEQMKREAAAN